MLAKIWGKAKNEKGFTLFEVLAVVVILGLLTAIAIPVYKNVTEKAADRVVEANHRVLISAVQMYRFVNDLKDPSDIKDLDEYVEGGIDNLGPEGATYIIEERPEGSGSWVLVSSSPSGEKFEYEITERQ